MKSSSFSQEGENDTTREYLEQPTKKVINISTALFLLRNRNTAMANIEAINTKQHGGENNENSN